MIHRTTSFLVTVAAGSALIAIGLYARTNSNRAVFEIDAASLDLGRIWLSEHCKHKLVVTNPTYSTVKIDSFQASCACTRIEPSSCILAPRESKTIILHVDSTQTVRPNLNDHHWHFSIGFRAQTNGNFQPRPWLLKGEVVSPLLRLPEPTEERLRLTRTDRVKRLECPIEPISGVSFVDATTNSPGASVSTIRRSGLRIVVLEIDPAYVDEGLSDISTELMFKDLQGTILPAVTWRIPIYAKPSVDLDPPTLLMHARNSTESVILRAPVGATFEVTGIKECEGIETRLLPKVKEHPELQTIEITSTQYAETQTFVAVVITVSVADSAIQETLTLLVQRPSKLFASERLSTPFK